MVDQRVSSSPELSASWYPMSCSTFLYVSPRVAVPFKYRMNRFAAAMWVVVGELINRNSRPTTSGMSGLVQVAR